MHGAEGTGIYVQSETFRSKGETEVRMAQYSDNYKP